MEGALQHATAALVAGLQAPGAGGSLGQATGAWGCGKRYAFPTSPHPRLRLRTNIQRGVTLTFHLVQNIGQVIITTYNQHVRLLPPEPWLFGSYQVYSTRGSRHCYEIKWRCQCGCRMLADLNEAAAAADAYACF